MKAKLALEGMKVRPEGLYSLAEVRLAQAKARHLDKHRLDVISNHFIK